MNKIVEAMIVFFAICLVILGAIFIVAAEVENVIIGAALVLVAVVMFAFVYRLEKIQASKPTLVSQTFNVKMEGSGQQEQKQMQCKSCGAPLSEKNLTVIQGGIMAKCPYCGATYAIEEAPKW
jgi:predicted RNA-binding Zn-ribbon protein involved in translation (DUF1610 family)